MIDKCLVRQVKISEPTHRKCYKCQQVKTIDKFYKSPTPNKTNQGYTWACKGCLTRETGFENWGYETVKI